MIRVLHVVDTLERGGAESLIMNLYRHINRDLIQFDFVTHSNRKDGYYREVLDLGGIVYSAPRFNGKNLFHYINWWDSFFSNHQEYQIVHGHMRSCASLYLSRGKRSGRITIAHSHSISNGSGVGSFVKAFLQYPLRYQSDYYMACSMDSARWLFGKKAALKSTCYILKNAIDLHQFSFNEEVRKKYRKDLGITEDQLVICHVGNYTEAKNHSFVIEMFREISSLRSSRLVLVGTGSEKQVEHIKSIVEKYNLKDKVLILGSRDDVNNLLSAADAFILPSKWEGFGIAALEAQAVGLQTFVSEKVPSDVGVTELVHFLPIDQGPKEWVEAILKCDSQHIDVQGKIRAAGFDIEENANWLTTFYENVSSAASGEKVGKI